MPSVRIISYVIYAMDHHRLHQCTTQRRVTATEYRRRTRCTATCVPAYGEIREACAQQHRAEKPEARTCATHLLAAAPDEASWVLLRILQQLYTSVHT